MNSIRDGGEWRRMKVRWEGLKTIWCWTGIVVRLGLGFIYQFGNSSLWRSDYLDLVSVPKNVQNVLIKWFGSCKCRMSAFCWDRGTSLLTRVWSGWRKLIGWCECGWSGLTIRWSIPCWKMSRSAGFAHAGSESPTPRPTNHSSEPMCS